MSSEEDASPISGILNGTGRTGFPADNSGITSSQEIPPTDDQKSPASVKFKSGLIISKLSIILQR